MNFKNKKSYETRTPLDAAPLRYAGQSLDEEIQRLLDDEVTEAALIGVFAVTLAALEWWRSFMQAPPSPILYSG